MLDWLGLPENVGHEESARAHMLRVVCLTTIGLVIALMPAVAIAQPELTHRAVFVATAVIATCILSLRLNRTRHPGASALSYLAGILLVIALNAVAAGGIKSPGVQALIVFVMLAGVLIDFRAGVIVGAAAALLGLAFVVLDTTHHLPRPTVFYSPLSLWLIDTLYIAVALLVLRVATTSILSALRRANTELVERRRAEARLAQALEAGAIGIFEQAWPSGEVVVDEVAMKLMGLEPGERGHVLISDWLARVHPDDRALIEEDYERFAAGETRRRTLYRYQHPDGTLRHLDAAAYLHVGENGRPASIVGMIRDATEREQSAHERAVMAAMLTERVKELRLLHEGAKLLHDAAVFDQSVMTRLAALLPGAWLYSDDAEARLAFGDIEVTTPGWRDSPWRLTAHVTTSEGNGVVEVIYRSDHTQDDEDPFLPEERELIRSLAELVGARIEQDATERRRLLSEAQLRHSQKLDALGRLAGGVAHDFNNILTAITANADLAFLDASSPATVAYHLREIQGASERARDLVKRILLFSRQHESHRQPVQIVPLIHEVVELLRVGMPSDVRIEVTVAHDITPVVFADSSQLHQVLMNLGTNAIYAMRAAGGVLRIAVDFVDTGDSDEATDLLPGRYIAIRVSDTGTGMPPEVLARLFEPFYTTKGAEGTGLGLSVVHGIVTDHNGSVTVRSEPGKGTEFSVLLPITTALPAQTTSHGMVRGNGEHFMLVDDQPTIAVALSRMIRRLGYNCTEYSDPRMALDAFDADPMRFDGVITDYSMPEISGFDLLRRIRRVRPDIPVGVASGQPPDSTDGSDDVGQLVWISKPVALAELSHHLEQMCKLARADSAG